MTIIILVFKIKIDKLVISKVDENVSERSTGDDTFVSFFLSTVCYIFLKLYLCFIILSLYQRCSQLFSLLCVACSLHCWLDMGHLKKACCEQKIVRIARRVQMIVKCEFNYLYWIYFKLQC